MTPTTRRALLWSPRILGICNALFLALFAMDALAEGPLALLIHAAPALFLLLVVALAWRWAWIGGLVFIALALLYAATTLQRPDWILSISGPLLAVGILFLLSWRYRDYSSGFERLKE